jgi:gamma-glutamylcyclotransferase (GGCT)/AIG2-like uncharacterized protein YtfP
MTLHFAYGTNMSRALMGARCPTAEALGPASLRGFRFLITRDGYASVAPAAGAAAVHGVLWRLKPRDLAALNAYESLDTGLYRWRMLPVRCGGRRTPALVYIGRSRTRGRPRPGQIALIAAAAREWQLPESYVRSIEQWSASRWGGAREPDIGEIA